MKSRPGFLNGLDATARNPQRLGQRHGRGGQHRHRHARPPIAADFTGPSIAINPIPTPNGDDTLNIAEREDGFEVSGTTDRVAPEGSTVTVTVNGVELVGPVTVDANGDWSVTVDQDDGGTFPLNGPVTIEAEVTDDDSGIPASAAPLDLDVDLEAPTVTINTPIAGDDNTLNIAEQDAGITISGTTTGVEDTQQVEVRLLMTAPSFPAAAVTFISPMSTETATGRSSFPTPRLISSAETAASR